MRVNHVSAYEDCKTAANVDETMTSKERAAAVDKARWFLAHADAYDWQGVALIGLRDLGLHWRILIRLLRGKRALFCSQLVAICGVAAGLESWRCGKSSTAYVTPADLSRRPQVRVVQS